MKIFSQSSNKMDDDTTTNDRNTTVQADEDDRIAGSSPTRLLLSCSIILASDSILQDGPRKEHGVRVDQEEKANEIKSKLKYRNPRQHDDADDIPITLVPKNSTSTIRFSTVEVLTHVVEYCPFQFDKTCPLTLGHMILDRSTYNVDVFEKDHQKHDKYTTAKTTMINQQIDDGKATSPELSTTNTNTSTTTAMTTTATRTIGKTNRAKRLSTKARRNRLLEMGYSNAELEILDVRRNVQQIMQQQQQKRLQE